MRVVLLMLIVIAMVASSAQARIYTCKDKNGNTVYSDTPSVCIDAEEVKVDTLPELIKTKPVAVPRSTSSKTNASKQVGNGGYKSLTITTPSDQENVRSNEGKVLIAFQASPALKSRNGHQYVISVGGKEVYKGPKTSVALENVDRGTHAVTAKIIARNGKTLISSEAVQFTLHRFSSLQGGRSSNSGSSNGGSNSGTGGSSGGSPTPGPPSSSSSP